MRNLTIKRTKTFVGCLGKLKVYIEDSNCNEIVIKGVNCRKLGELKNDEEKTFEIPEAAAKIFVIADQLSKDYCNEYYQLEYGEEDIYLSGKCHLNPAAGNAFQLDNNDTPEVLAARKKNSSKGLVVLIVAVIVGFAVGFLISSGILFD